MTGVFRNISFIFKRIKLDFKVNNHCVHKPNNLVMCRRHFVNVISVNRTVKLGLYSIVAAPRLFRIYRPISSLNSKILNKKSEAEDAQSVASALLASKLNEQKEDSSKNEEDKKNAKRALKFTYYSMGALFIGGGISLLANYGGTQIDPEGNEIIDEFTEMPIVQQYLYRTAWQIQSMTKTIQEPSNEKLLPDAVKEPYFQPPYTLVLEMKDILVHPEWTYATGWRFKKRPGVDLLLQTCGAPLFEIVIYTSEQAMTAFPVVAQMDTNNLIWYKLFKDSTRYVEGKHLKDLNHLNRDLKKVIIVDWDKEAITTPRNQLCIKRWNGDLDDTTLVDLAAFLKTIADSEVADVRDILDYYRNFDDPIKAFRDNERAAQLRDEELAKNAPTTTKGLIGSSWTSSFFKRQ